AVLLTVFGDLFAAIMGKSFGKTIIWKKKTFVGTFSGFAANIITGLILLPNHLALTVPMAITASVVELLTHKLEDNLTVPLFSGFVGQMIVYFFALQIPNVGFKMFGII
ncbi:hypothetical protein HZC20_00605, partial [Candidatus Peregrinibacteria bacterium]|nr:hypothetical protein [Candidatus Peregrinibacteria bacterium]